MLYLSPLINLTGFHLIGKLRVISLLRNPFSGSLHSNLMGYFSFLMNSTISASTSSEIVSSIWPYSVGDPVRACWKR